jgi:hypothetical protein
MKTSNIKHIENIKYQTHLILCCWNWYIAMKWRELTTRRLTLLPPHVLLFIYFLLLVPVFRHGRAQHEVKSCSCECHSGIWESEGMTPPIPVWSLNKGEWLSLLPAAIPPRGRNFSGPIVLEVGWVPVPFWTGLEFRKNILPLPVLEPRLWTRSIQSKDCSFPLPDMNTEFCNSNVNRWDPLSFGVWHALQRDQQKLIWISCVKWWEYIFYDWRIVIDARTHRRREGNTNAIKMKIP